MKKVLLTSTLLLCAMFVFGQSWIRVNQVGYFPKDVKVAVLISLDDANNDFGVYDAKTDKLVFSGKGVACNASKWGMKSAYRLNFSSLNTQGGYYIKSNGAVSVPFRIGTDMYAGMTDYLLTYMRQQRCGDNPHNNVLCHQHDAYIVDHPTKTGEMLDVRGGWHDAADYLQYLTTSATATYHLLFAYSQAKDKSIFKDEYDASGRKGKNGIPDIIDEARWGLDWMDRMNPAPREYYNQIADDRDHASFRLPFEDSVDYGWGPAAGRPVYFVTGKPQGLGKWKNRTTGVSSTVGKYASTFALGAEVMKDFYPELAQRIEKKIMPAYEYALEVPGNTQTACLKSKYFYEEDSYTDDVELAAATLYRIRGEEKWLKEADYWGELEPISPWMELGRGRHYQFYPFINLGHFYLAQSTDSVISSKYAQFMRNGLEDIASRGKDDPFMNGIPYIWCSNNLASAALTQARLYNEATGDSSFLEMEAALRDWFFGCNPWGTSMVTGIPFAPISGYDYPSEPHSAYVLINNEPNYGGLVDGPIYRDLFASRAGNALRKKDELAAFNNGAAVYHEDIGDYASNEQTMDGTAGLAPYFASLEAIGRAQQELTTVVDTDGAMVRVAPEKKNIFLVFTADANFQGAEKILDVLKKNRIHGSFFLTGNALRNKTFAKSVKRIVKDGHYLGGHSNNHLQYAAWGSKKETLVLPDNLIADIRLNFAELENVGVDASKATWYLPPYEHYNKENVEVMKAIGLKVVNYTPGTATPADYTTPSMPSYKSSQQLIDALYKFEKEKGLNGAVVLMHPGLEDSRTDRLYERLDEIVKYLNAKGYSFISFNEL